MLRAKSKKVTKSICIGRLISVFVSEQFEDKIENVKSWTACTGGSAANVARALARLGCQAGLVGCIGDDDTGKMLSQSLIESGVDAVGLRSVADTQTGWLWVLRHPNGHRSFHAPQISFEHFADSLLSTFDIDPIWFQSSNFLVPQALHLGTESSREALVYAQELALKANTPIFFDLNYRAFAWKDLATTKKVTSEYARSCQIIKLDIEESQIIFGVETVRALANLLPNARGILLTRGADGCDYILDGNEGSVPGFLVKVEDSTGAGDAFFAAFISKIDAHGLESLSDKEACREFVRFSNAAGAICVSKIGPVNSLPGVEEIEALISEVDALVKIAV